MASSLLPLALLLLAQCISPPVLAATPAPSPSPAPPSPSPAPTASTKINITGILDKGGQFTKLIRLLNATGIVTQLETQLNNSRDGITMLAPTDNAFNNLESGYLNGLSNQQQIALLQYHVITKYYTLNDLTQVSNPVRTQASGQLGGNFFLNFIGKTDQVNVSTGVVQTQVNNAIYTTSPLSVFTVDVVLKPIEFSKNYTAPAPAPGASPKASSSGGGDTVPSQSATAKNGAEGRRTTSWLMSVVGVLCIIALT